MPTRPPARLFLDRAPSPIGELLLASDAEGMLRAVDFHDFEPRMLRLLGLHYGAVALEPGAAPTATRVALAAYFEGDLTALTAIPWTTGGTAFQQAVWRALGDVAAGTTLTYAALALRIGKPAAVRAVGAANGANPLSIVVPCHRLVGANGALTGYGGGVERKAWLLAHEGARPRG
ncbi:methylated-DNA--[protein]-cysteine S-methyltransferase [Caulobacter endophyticus]|uniref:methylated-DNA--[protein]-cysteine S-methyltransferase n=1 Tax=Caulobacter endophyticus TaxID=2172652 RepID=UPI00240F644D|nr:methylated-DNA--[protein]-cysteine S-methyltransferase [Caulobacter endophyticus]MDG2527725.1 methylated-DNA--[protein]-cysteine S-methyltransferase [Caulobacter endophyticus]